MNNLSNSFNKYNKTFDSIGTELSYSATSDALNSNETMKQTGGSFLGSLFGNSENKNVNMTELIMDAVENGQTQVADFLLSKKFVPDVNSVDNNGNNFMHTLVVAAANKSENAKKALSQLLTTDKYRELMNKGNKHGDTPLHYAVAAKLNDFAQLMINNGAKRSFNKNEVGIVTDYDTETQTGRNIPIINKNSNMSSKNISKQEYIPQNKESNIFTKTSHQVATKAGQVPDSDKIAEIVKAFNTGQSNSDVYTYDLSRTEDPNSAAGIIDSAKYQVNKISDFVKTQTPEIIDKVKTETPELLNKVKTQGSELVNKIKTEAPEMWENVKSQAPQQWENARNQGNDLWENVKNQGTQELDLARTKGNNFMDKTRNQAPDMMNNAKKQGYEMWKDAKNQGNDMWDNTKTQVSGEWDNVQTKVKNYMDKTRNQSNEMWENAKTQSPPEWDNAHSKTQGNESWDMARSKGNEFMDRTRTQGNDSLDFAKTKGNEFMDRTRTRKRSQGNDMWEKTKSPKTRQDKSNYKNPIGDLDSAAMDSDAFVQHIANNIAGEKIKLHGGSRKSKTSKSKKNSKRSSNMITGNRIMKTFSETNENLNILGGMSDDEMRNISRAAVNQKDKFHIEAEEKILSHLPDKDRTTAKAIKSIIYSEIKKTKADQTGLDRAAEMLKLITKKKVDEILSQQKDLVKQISADIDKKTKGRSERSSDNDNSRSKLKSTSNDKNSSRNISKTNDPNNQSRSKNNQSRSKNKYESSLDSDSSSDFSSNNSSSNKSSYERNKDKKSLKRFNKSSY